MNFHDCIVEKLILQESSLEIYLDNSGGFTDVNKVRFDNCDIIKQEGAMEEAWWLYDEIYPIKNGYEVHVLLENEQRSLIEFILTAQGIQFFKEI